MKYDLKDVEIFAAGKWNGDNYTESDLKEIVDGFNATFGALQPYVKLGHDAAQPLLAKDGLPAAGWITSLRTKGGKLLADIKDVPRKVYELIRAGAYKRVSSEIFFNIEVAGKKYPKLLKAIALLGADTPAVQTLDDVLALYGYESIEGIKLYREDENEVRPYEYETDVKIYEEGKPMEKLMQLMKGLMDKMGKGEKVEMAEAKACGDALRKEFQFSYEKSDEETQKEQQMAADLETRDAAIASKDAEIKALTEKNAELTTKIYSAEVDAKVKELVDNKKIAPAQADAVKGLLMEFRTSGSTKKYKLGDKEVGAEEMFVAFTDTLSVNINTDGQTKQGVPQLSDEPDEKGFTGSHTDAEAKKYMADHEGVSYKQALIEVEKKHKQSQK